MGFAVSAKPKKTLYDGSDCAGVDGAVNRTLTHTKAMLSHSLVIVGRSTLFEGAGIDYTVSGNVVTFLINIDNTDKIMVYD